MGRLVLADLARPRVGECPAGNSGNFVRRWEAGTIDSSRHPLRAALSVAVRRGRIPVNHAQGRMEAVPERKASEAGPIWEPDETARFLEHVAEDRLAALYELAALGHLLGTGGSATGLGACSEINGVPGRPMATACSPNGGCENPYSPSIVSSS